MKSSTFSKQFRVLAFRQMLQVAWWAFWKTKRFTIFRQALLAGKSVMTAYNEATGGLC